MQIKHISSLNSTYQRKGWPNINDIIPYCEKIMKLSAICKICANAANYSYRHTTSGDQATKIIGGAEIYMPLCRECYNHKMKQRTDIKGNQ